MSGKKRQNPGDGPTYKQFLCRVCEIDRGVATSNVVEQYSHVMLNAKTGKVNRKKSFKRLVCTYCLMNGKLTFVD